MRLPGQRRDKMDIKKASDVIAMHLTLSDLRNCMCLLGVTSFQRHQFSAVHFSAEHFNAVHFSGGGEGGICFRGDHSVIRLWVTDREHFNVVHFSDLHLMWVILSDVSDHSFIPLWVTNQWSFIRHRVKQCQHPFITLKGWPKFTRV